MTRGNACCKLFITYKKRERRSILLSLVHYLPVQSPGLDTVACAVRFWLALVDPELAFVVQRELGNPGKFPRIAVRVGDVTGD